MQLLNQSWNGKKSYPPGGENPSKGSSQQQNENNNQSQVIRNWLISKLAERLEIDPQDIDEHQEMADYGLNSLEAVSLSGELENFLSRRLPPTLLWDYPTLASLVDYLAASASAEPDFSQKTHTENPEPNTPINPESAQKLLENIEHLSDAEIEALLERLLSEQEGQG